MPTLRDYRIFISHAWRYSSDYERMVQLLNAAPSFTWSNYSAPRADPLDVNSSTRLSEAIRRQIRPAQVVLILAGMYVNHSEWIQFEINFAQELRKPIIGVYPWGSERAPLAVEQVAKQMVGWNTASIVTAIRSWAI